MIDGDRLRQIEHIVFIQETGIKLLVELGVLWELMHLQGVLYGSALTVHFWTRLTAADRHDIDIKLWRHPPVEPQFLLTKMSALLQCAEVQEFQFDGFLYLVREGSGENHPGDVGLYQF